MDFIYTDIWGGRALEFIYANVRFFRKKACRLLRKIKKDEV